MTTGYEAVSGPTLITGHNLGIFIDGYLRERHEVTTSISEHPIERGSRLGDHVSREPYVLDVVGYVSDVLPSTSDVALEVRATRAWAAILGALEPPVILTVTTLLGTYRNMVVASADAPQDESTGRGLLVNLRLREIQTAEAIAFARGGVPKVAGVPFPPQPISAQGEFDVFNTPTGAPVGVTGAGAILPRSTPPVNIRGTAGDVLEPSQYDYALAFRLIQEAREERDQRSPGDPRGDSLDIDPVILEIVKNGDRLAGEGRYRGSPTVVPTGDPAADATGDASPGFLARALGVLSFLPGVGDA